MKTPKVNFSELIGLIKKLLNTLKSIYLLHMLSKYSPESVLEYLYVIFNIDNLDLIETKTDKILEKLPETENNNEDYKDKAGKGASEHKAELILAGFVIIFFIGVGLFTDPPGPKNFPPMENTLYPKRSLEPFDLTYVMQNPAHVIREDGEIFYDIGRYPDSPPNLSGTLSHLYDRSAQLSKILTDQGNLGAGKDGTLYVKSNEQLNQINQIIDQKYKNSI